MADEPKVPEHWMIEFQEVPEDVYDKHVAEYGSDDGLCEGLYFPIPLIGPHGFEPGYMTRAAALEAVHQHDRVVVESSPEVAALRARVAELEAALAVADAPTRAEKMRELAETIGERESRIRADERARAEREIASYFDGALRMLRDVVRASDYPKEPADG